MNRAEHAERIARFMNYDFGPVPRMGTEEERLEAAYGYVLERAYPEGAPDSFKKRFFEECREREAEVWDRIGGSYDDKKHLLFNDGPFTSFVLVHELSHAFVRNHWPHFIQDFAKHKINARVGDFNAIKESFVYNALHEGFADMVALAEADICPRYLEQVEFHQLGERFTVDHGFAAIKLLTEGKNNRLERFELFEVGSRTIGLQYLLEKVARADDRFAAMDALVNNIPQTLYELYRVDA